MRTHWALQVAILCSICSSCDRPAVERKERNLAVAQQSRAEWHRERLIDVYRTSRYTRPTWDGAAEEALELFADLSQERNP